MKRRIFISLTIIVPLALFLLARLAANKRPMIIGQHAGATSLQFSPDGRRMLSYSKAEVSSWDLQKRRREATWKSGLSYVFSPDGRSLAATGSRYENVDTAHARTIISGVVNDVTTGHVRVRFNDNFTHPTSFQDFSQRPVWSADGREIWVLSSFHLRRFDASSGRLLSRLALSSLRDFDPLRTTFLLPDLSFVVSNNHKSKNIELRDIKTGVVARSWKVKVPVAGVTPIALFTSPDARFMEIGFDGKGADVNRIYRISDGKSWEAPIDAEPFRGFSVDSRLAIFADESHFIARDINTGRELWRMELPHAQSFALAPDSRHLYNVDAQGIIRRWDVR